jgi:hypothetical protein
VAGEIKGVKAGRFWRILFRLGVLRNVINFHGIVGQSKEELRKMNMGH